jgi:hypothetical protein
MKRFLAPALALSLACGFGLVGCSDKTTEQTETKVSGPSGTATETTTHEIKTSGNPPAPGAPGTTTETTTTPAR